MFCRSLGFCNVEVEDWKAKGNQAYYLYTELSWTLTSQKIVLFCFLCDPVELSYIIMITEFSTKSTKPMQINIFEGTST